jgi:acetylornithine deacetylase/succinyl-diaminopimelate desuccinylase-like protein
MQARAYVSEELRKAGARISTTVGGNLVGQLEGSARGLPSVMTGSHIDSVLHGGRFDGVAGVVAALEVVRVMAEQKVPHRHPVDGVVDGPGSKAWWTTCTG